MASPTKGLRIAFFGTPQFAVDILNELATAHITPTVVVASPDAPRGRGLVLTPPETKTWAEAHEIPVLQPETLRLKGNDPDRDILYNSEWDLFIVASYGKILPQSLLDIPKHGTLNVHPSLLPQYRGASPVRTAILEDNPDAVGVSIMLLDAGMDSGPIVAQGRITLERESGDWPVRAPMLEQLLAHEGGQLLAEILPEWLAGSVTPEPQDHTAATFSEKIDKHMGLLDLSADPWKNYLTFCALDGAVGTYFFIEKDARQMRVKITDASFCDNAFVVERVIPEGKKEMSYADFKRSYES